MGPAFCLSFCHEIHFLEHTHDAGNSHGFNIYVSFYEEVHSLPVGFRSFFPMLAGVVFCKFIQSLLTCFDMEPAKKATGDNFMYDIEQYGKNLMPAVRIVLCVRRFFFHKVPALSIQRS